MGWGDCVKMMLYFSPGCDPAVLREARAAALGEDLACAATTVGVVEVAGEPGAVVTVDIIAAKCDEATASL